MARAGISASVTVCLGLALGSFWLPETVFAQDSAPSAPQSAPTAKPAETPLIKPDAPPGMRRNAADALVRSMAGQVSPSDDTPAHDPIVVELFTSQGCSSCPPADALFETYADRDDVIALALHVDYWDYLGWKDPFGKAEFTARQKAYARAARERTVYTPQMIVGGTTALVGVQKDELKVAIAQQSAVRQPVHLKISGADGDYEVLLSADPPLSAPAVVQIVRYMPEARIAILRGENAGQTIDYRNIVTEWHAVAEWDGKTPTRIKVDLDGADPGVVIVQAAQPGQGVPLPGKILAAGRLE
ncbi:thioredoxin family protein [uncultured Thioclava sp.]|uniref:DUF1223 domain-containing protein n=1 Tax=uncultured Thioclava sp. TaxID=473858 RepID=UPI0025E1805F|nr:DUF1223 domain-containing protein [uncultured Thioclava sp.]